MEQEEISEVVNELLKDLPEAKIIPFIKEPHIGAIVKVYHDITTELIGYGVVKHLTTFVKWNRTFQGVALERIDTPEEEPDFYFLNYKISWL